MSNVQQVLDEADRRTAGADPGEMSDDTQERVAQALALAAGELPVLSEVGRPRVCPTCGGASVYAQRMAMEGRACRYASKGEAIIAWYCGEHQRKHEAFDVDLLHDVKAAEVGGWNLEVLDAVRGMAKHVVRDAMNARAIMSSAMEHIGALEAQLAEKSQALLAARESEQKLLAAVEAPKKKRRDARAGLIAYGEKKVKGKRKAKR